MGVSLAGARAGLSWTEPALRLSRPFGFHPWRIPLPRVHFRRPALHGQYRIPTQAYPHWFCEQKQWASISRRSSRPLAGAETPRALSRVGAAGLRNLWAAPKGRLAPDTLALPGRFALGVARLWLKISERVR